MGCIFPRCKYAYEHWIGSDCCGYICMKNPAKPVQLWSLSSEYYYGKDLECKVVFNDWSSKY